MEYNIVYLLLLLLFIIIMLIVFSNGDDTKKSDLKNHSHYWFHSKWSDISHNH